MNIKLKPGDVLLLPTKYTEIYTLIAGTIGATVTQFLPKLLGEPYLHAELYIGKGYTMAAWTNGVHVHRYPLSTQMKFDVFRHRDEDKAPKAIERLMLEDFKAYLEHRPTRFLNKPYDFQSLFLNTIAELAQVLKHEKTVEENTMRIDTPDAFMCSELVARVYKEAGYDLKTGDKSPEWVSPSDLALSPMLYKVI